MESIYETTAAAGGAHPAADTAGDEPSAPDAHALEEQIRALFAPDLLRDLLTQVPGIPLYGVQSALLFVGSRGDLFIMNSRKHGPYWVSEETLRAAFTQVASDSGMLPAGTLRLGSTPSGDHWIAVYVPPARYTLQLAGLQPTLISVHVPLPGLVFAGRGSQYFLWAVKEPLIRAETPVYHAPLPNVSTGNGLICNGGVTPPPASAETILSTFRLLLEASLYNGAMVQGCSGRHPEDVRLLLLELAREGSVTFPSEDLVAVGDYRGTITTVQNVLHRHIIGRIE